MRCERWVVLALYTAGIFLSLPYTPQLVKWTNARFGSEAAIAAVGAVLVAAGALFARRLMGRRPAFPWPHLALVALGSASWAAWRLLASSPIGRVHLPEYGLLAILAAWAVGGASGAAIGSGVAVAGVGFLDELTQLITLAESSTGGTWRSTPRPPSSAVWRAPGGAGPEKRSRDYRAPPAAARSGSLLAAARCSRRGGSRPSRSASSNG